MLRRMLMFAFVFAAIHAVAAETSKSRHFTFHYAFSVRGVEPGKPIQVWLPLAHSDRYQDVRVIATHGDLPLKQMRESEYGNRMLFASAKRARKRNISSPLIMTLCVVSTWPMVRRRWRAKKN